MTAAPGRLISTRERAMTEIISRAVILTGHQVLVARLRGRSWSFLPGGHHEAGETLLASLRRELHEELRAELRSAEPIGTVEYAYNDSGTAHHEINHVFAAVVGGLAGPGEVVESPEDHLEFAWVAADRLALEPLRPEPLKQALLSWLQDRRPFQVALGCEPAPPVTEVRRSARALLLDDDDDLILFRRTVSGRRPYWTTPGGRTEPGDADLEATLRREIFEELGAAVGPTVQVFAARQTFGGITRVQHFFACRLVEMDLTRRTGAEFSEPGRGTYEVDRVPFTFGGVDSIDLIPEELCAYLDGNIPTVLRLLDLVSARSVPD
jgi:8-oxo-dGTP pyrophosphatase MutT (NUDIX family)